MLEKIGNALDYPIDFLAGNSITGNVVSGIRESPILRSLVSLTVIPGAASLGFSAGKTALRFQNNVLNYVDRAAEAIEKFKAPRFPEDPAADSVLFDTAPVRLGDKSNYRYTQLPVEKTYSDGTFFYGNNPAHVVSADEYASRWSMDSWLSKKNAGRNLKPDDAARYFRQTWNNDPRKAYKYSAKLAHTMDKFGQYYVPSSYYMYDVGSVSSWKNNAMKKIHKSYSNLRR